MLLMKWKYCVCLQYINWNCMDMCNNYFNHQTYYYQKPCNLFFTVSPKKFKSVMTQKSYTYSRSNFHTIMWENYEISCAMMLKKSIIGR